MVFTQRQREAGFESGKLLDVATDAGGGGGGSAATAAKTIAIKPEALYKMLIAKEPSYGKSGQGSAGSALATSVQSVGNKWVELVNVDGKGATRYMDHAKAVAYLNADADGQEKMLADIALFTREEGAGTTLGRKLALERSAGLLENERIEGQVQYDGGRPKLTKMGYAIDTENFTYVDDNGNALTDEAAIKKQHVLDAVRRAEKILKGREFGDTRVAAAYFVSIVIGSGAYLERFVKDYLSKGESAEAELEKFMRELRPLKDGKSMAMSEGAVTFNLVNFGKYRDELLRGVKTVEFADSGVRFELEQPPEEIPVVKAAPKSVPISMEVFFFSISPIVDNKGVSMIPKNNRELRDGVIGGYLRYEVDGVERNGIIRLVGKDGTLKVTYFNKEKGIFEHSMLALDESTKILEYKNNKAYNPKDAANVLSDNDAARKLLDLDAAKQNMSMFDGLGKAVESKDAEGLKDWLSKKENWRFANELLEIEGKKERKMGKRLLAAVRRDTATPAEQKEAFDRLLSLLNKAVLLPVVEKAPPEPTVGRLKAQKGQEEGTEPAPPQGGITQQPGAPPPSTIPITAPSPVYPIIAEAPSDAVPGFADTTELLGEIAQLPAGKIGYGRGPQEITGAGLRKKIEDLSNIADQKIVLEIYRIQNKIMLETYNKQLNAGEMYDAIEEVIANKKKAGTLDHNIAW